MSDEISKEQNKEGQKNNNLGINNEIKKKKEEADDQD